MKVAELFAELGYEVNDEGLQEFNRGINEGTKKIGVYAAALGAAMFAVKKFTDSTVKAAASLYNFRIETGLSADELQRWQNAATFSDITADADSVTASIRNLQSNLQQIRLGNGNTRPFYMFGVSAGQDALGVLEQLRGKMDMFNEGMTVNLLQEMGLGTEMLHVLRMSNEEFDQLANNYILSGEQTANVREMGIAFRKLGKQLSFVKDEFVAFISPFIADATRALSYAVKLLVAPFEALAYVIKEIFKLFSNTEGKILAVAAAFYYLRRGGRLFLALLGSILGKIVLLLVAVEDVVTGMRGGFSVITSLLELAGIKIINLVIQGIKNIKEMAEEIGRIIKEHLVDPINNAIDNAKGFIGRNTRDLAEGIVDSTPDWLFNLMYPTGVNGSPAAAGSSSVTTFNNSFNIKSNNASQVAAEVKAQLEQQYSPALGDFNNDRQY